MKRRKKTVDNRQQLMKTYFSANEYVYIHIHISTGEKKRPTKKKRTSMSI